MTIRTIRRAALCAAALSLAAPAVAQTPPGMPAPRGGTAPAPGSPAAPGAATSDGTVGPISLELRQQLMWLHARNHGQLTAAQVAMKQASSQQVQQLAQRVNNDRTQVSVQMAQIAQQRGIPALAAPTAEAKAQSKAVVDKLAAENGPAFDKAYVGMVIRDYEQDEAMLKKMRDTQSGKDAALKGWLDNIENVMEDGLTTARQAKVALDSGAATSTSTKAQARTPPRPAPTKR